MTASSRLIHDWGSPWADNFKTFNRASIQQLKTTDLKHERPYRTVCVPFSTSNRHWISHNIRCIEDNLTTTLAFPGVFPGLSLRFLVVFPLAHITRPPMKVFRGFNHPGIAHACALTIGNFDGVHRGHQAMLALLRAEEGFRWVKGHKELGQLATALGRAGSGAGERSELASDSGFSYRMSISQPAGTSTI